MRTTIEIDDKLLKEALALTKAKTKRELFHRSLEALIRHQRIGLYDAAALDMVWGKVGQSLRRAGVRTKSDVDRLVKEVRNEKKVTTEKR